MPLGSLLDLAGGVFSDRQARKDRQRDRQLSQAQFDAQMDESVQRRVKDAEKAGIHPLFALGASSGASPTITAGGGRSPTGVRDAVGRAADRLAMRKLQKSEIARSEAAAKRDLAEAALLDSERARLAQDAASRGHDGAAVRGKESVLSDQPVYGPAEAVPQQVLKMSRPGVASGTNPLAVKVQDEFGTEFTLPNPDLGLDEMAQVDYAIGSLARIPGNVMKYFKSEARVKELDRELRRLKWIRNNPDKVAEYNRLKKVVRAKLRALYEFFTS